MRSDAAADRQAFWRDAIVIVAAVEAVAVAVWLIPASSLIVEWSASGPSRVALFAPLARLFWAALAGLAAAVGLAVGLTTAARQLVVGVVAPLCVLWLWVVPFLPWLPDRLPLLLVLAGPVRWIIAAAAALGAVASGGWLSRWSSGWGQLPGRRAAFAASLVLYAAFGLMHAQQVGPAGDEPHYLVIAHSLLADRDLKIEDNHQRGDYRAFYAGALRPDYMARGADGEIYSIHSPGLPAMLLPLYAVAGYRGALLLMALVGALAAVAIFDLAEATAASRGAAWLTWAATCLTVPFVPHSWLLFPEIPGALLTAWAALWIWRPPSGAVAWVWRGAALAMWPWLHTKYVVLLAIFALAIVVRLRREPRALTWFLVPNAILGALWLYSFYAIYGVFDPQAPYGTYTSQFVLFENIPRGVLGLLFDQKFGLLFYSPVYLLAAVGMWRGLRRSDLQLLFATLSIAAIAFVVSTTRLYMWWGGSSAPARFLVPILPCLAPFIALAVRELRSPQFRTVLGLGLAVSLGFAWIGAGWPNKLFLFSDPHGRARVIEALQAGSTLAGTLPTFTEGEWLEPLRPLAAWIGASLLATASLFIAARWTALRAPFWMGTVGALVFLVAASVGTARPAAATRDETALRGTLALLWNYDGERHRGFDFKSMERVAPEWLLQRRMVPMTGSPPAPVPLPPGSFEARIMLGGERVYHGELRVRSAQNAIFGRTEGTLHGQVVVPFDLPVGVGRVFVDAPDPTITKEIRSIEISPRAVVPRHVRDTRNVRALEMVEGRPGGYIAYLDDHSYPEGGVFWTRGAKSATILVAPGGASRLTLTLFVGPRRDTVHLSVAGEERSLTIDAGSVHVLELPVPPGVPLVPVSVRSEGMFRPADTDPESDDVRSLGCQVRIGLR